MAPANRGDDVDRFILERIDSVSHLEALLLIWRSRPKRWSADELGARIYLRTDATRNILQDLARQQLIAIVPETDDQYFFETKSGDQDRLLGLVDDAYRKELVRVSTMIHSKAPSSVREFAKAFRFVKGKDVKEKDKDKE